MTDDHDVESYAAESAFRGIIEPMNHASIVWKRSWTRRKPRLDELDSRPPIDRYPDRPAGKVLGHVRLKGNFSARPLKDNSKFLDRHDPPDSYFVTVRRHREPSS